MAPARGPGTSGGKLSLCRWSRVRSLLHGTDPECADDPAPGADPVFVALVLDPDGGHSWPAAIVFAVAGITDQIDGWLARRWRVESEFGRWPTRSPTG